MDSSVIADTASKFGRGIDLDRSFPGFPFDEESFGRRGDIRAHLDDLASRHPEFADHLLGPPWADIPFHGSTRDRRRGSGSVSNNNQNYQEDDTRSQASGSSAASGASAVSSHSEPDASRTPSREPCQNRESVKPQYGTRNTVDIGQHRHNMDHSDKGNRGQRSMSAPPENRQSQEQTNQQAGQDQQGPQRYVSRVDITPQNNQQSKSSSSNVRQIPIVVEGRDKPVISKIDDETPQSFQRQPSPHFNPPFGGRTHQPHQWSTHYQDPFFQHTFEPRKTQPQGFQRMPQRPDTYFESPSRQDKRSTTEQQQKQPPPPSPSPPQEQQEQEPSKPKQIIIPNDPLERVALVQKEVDSLAEQVRNYRGESRQDKRYMYLDEMLTRELIKLDDIETEGRENVRQTRKNAIKSIQDTISLLESKVPIPGQKINARVDEAKVVENMDEEFSNGPIPLPPPEFLARPGTDTKQTIENSNLTDNRSNTDVQIHCGNDGELTNQNMEVDKPTSGQSPKKIKKCTKQQPISDTPIPLPPPENID